MEDLRYLPGPDNVSATGGDGHRSDLVVNEDGDVFLERGTRSHEAVTPSTTGQGCCLGRSVVRRKWDCRKSVS